MKSGHVLLIPFGSLFLFNFHLCLFEFIMMLTQSAEEYYWKGNQPIFHQK